MRIDIIISAALVSVAIVIAAFIMRPAKYTTCQTSFIQRTGRESYQENMAFLLDTRSGEIVNTINNAAKQYNESVKTKTNK